MTPWPELQGAFAGALLDPQRPMPPGVVDPEGIPCARRFGVYRNNVTVGLAGALAESFPAVRRLVGEDFFRAMAIAYARAEPPRSPIMAAYGAGFPDFIARFEPAQSLTYLADVARIEQAWVEAYHAADPEPFDPAAFASVAPDALPHLRLRMHPSMRVVRSAYAALSIWRLNTEAEPGESSRGCRCPRGCPDPAAPSGGRGPGPRARRRPLSGGALGRAHSGRGLGRRLAGSGRLRPGRPSRRALGNGRDRRLRPMTADGGRNMAHSTDGESTGLTASYLRTLTGLASVAAFVAPPALRVALALPFFRSGLTRWDMPFHLAPSTLYLFEEEFRLHLFGQAFAFPAPDTVALLTATAELTLPTLLLLGLATRWTALGLLVMTGVIELVAPEGGLNFHLPWAAMAIAIMALGPGPLSVDQLIRTAWNRRRS